LPAVAAAMRWIAEFSLPPYLRSRQSKLTLILVPRSINFFVYGNGKHLYAEWFNGEERARAFVHVDVAVG
jgi:hypothetical protein